MSLVRFLTPLNAAQEYEKFLAQKNYNPQFVYEWSTPKIHKWLAMSPEYLPLYQAVVDQDYSRMTSTASDIFSTSIRSDFLEYAQTLVSQTPQPYPVRDKSKFAEAFQEAFDFFNLEQYKPKITDNHGFNFRPNFFSKKIYISQHSTLEFFSVNGAVKHELSHVLRFENGVFNNISKSKNCLPTEEGLASYCQDFTGDNGQASLFKHAAEYTVTDIALNGSLIDATDYLQSIGFSKPLAWQRAIRHKFGWVDTSKPGDIMKPSMYFYHQQFVKKLTREQKYCLYVGKIRVDELKNYPSYQGLIPLEKLTQFFNFQNN